MLLHDLGKGFESKSFFLDLLLGLRAASERLEWVLAVPGLEISEGRPADQAAPPESFELLALGVISFARTVRRHLDQVPQPAAPEQRPAQRSPGDLLY